MRICYVNGQFVPENQAQVSIFDRGYLFSDGVYEVSLVLNGQLIDNLRHLQRLVRSLDKLGIPNPMSIDEIICLQKEVIKKNNLINGAIYLQVTRGVDDDREFLFSDDLTPSLVIFSQAKDLLNNPLFDKGVSVMTLPDIRWAKRDIKAIGLLGAVLAKKTANDNGYDDAWFVEDGYVTEGSSNNTYIIKDNNLITKKTNEQILGGITRQAVLEIAKKRKLNVIERNFTVKEAQCADEAFATSAVMLIVGVVKIDDKIIANGKPGPITQQIRQAYIDIAKLTTT